MIRGVVIHYHDDFYGSIRRSGSDGITINSNTPAVGDSSGWGAIIRQQKIGRSGGFAFWTGEPGVLNPPGWGGIMTSQLPSAYNPSKWLAGNQGGAWRLGGRLPVLAGAPGVWAISMGAAVFTNPVMLDVISDFFDKPKYDEIILGYNPENEYEVLF